MLQLLSVREPNADRKDYRPDSGQEKLPKIGPSIYKALFVAFGHSRPN